MQVCSCSFNEEGVYLAGGSRVDACGLRDNEADRVLSQNLFRGGLETKVLGCDLVFINVYGPVFVCLVQTSRAADVQWGP